MSGGSFNYLYSRFGVRHEDEAIGKALATLLAESGEAKWLESQALQSTLS